ncbi:hypothetical protein C1J05_14920 [Sulfitobacter sp. JL08]|uniref:hypothetical protein n=1 Tax=Sulfitobacter sp. JL08 TaxID=2070369 RepID=UPI000E0A522A|nr:hypothetical protein [Sulfitobacter sp. JL08]AXI55622.1 hypothetical protein C1J05_14920 [Sulfitobacter sp. JL08]
MSDPTEDWKTFITKRAEKIAVANDQVILDSLGRILGEERNLTNSQIKDVGNRIDQINGVEIIKSAAASIILGNVGALQSVVDEVTLKRSVLATDEKDAIPLIRKVLG